MTYVYIDSFSPKHSAQSKKLIALFQAASTKQYVLTDNPSTADVILLCDAQFELYPKIIKENLVLKKHANKCFILSNDDRPIMYHRGIYTSAEKSLLNFGRIRSCSYTAYFDPFKNPLVWNHNFENKTPKKYLFSFIGSKTHYVREQIFDLIFTRPDQYIQDSSSLFSVYASDDKFERQRFFYRTLLSSKFSLCPRGWGANSFRLFESMYLAVAPVIISDQFLLPHGPKWDRFSIIIKSKHINELEKIITSYENCYDEMGQMAKSAYEEHFSENAFFNYIMNNCREIQSKQIIPETFFYKLSSLRLLGSKFMVRISGYLNRFL